MKKSKIILSALSALTICAGLLSCGGNNTSTNKSCKVDFLSFNEVVNTIQVDYGKRITQEIADPVSPNDSFKFTGWYKQPEATTKWVFEKDIVKSDLSLYAGWMEITSEPTNVSTVNEAFTSSLEWIQNGVTSTTEFEVNLYKVTNTTVSEEATTYEYSSTAEKVVGTYSYDENTFKVTYTPSVIPQGGRYKVGIKTDGGKETFAEDIILKGEGTSTNPYLVSAEMDMDAITKADEKKTVGTDKYYKLFNDVTVSTDYTTEMNVTFDGTFDGNNHDLVIDGNCGAFGIVGTKGLIKNATVKGVASTSTWPYIGALANTNKGTVENAKSYANVTSTAGEVANVATQDQGGAGGLVGLNEVEGKINNSIYSGITGTSSSTGVVKAVIGGGGIAGTNKGSIKRAVNHGCLGAYNSVESGKSLSAYSYIGGVAGFNYGTIEESTTNSVGKLLAQRASSDDTAVENNNIAVGGIAGYNTENAVIKTSYFEGIRVHGDQAVGGIAGINAGKIQSSYSNAKFFTSTNMRSYIGGRLEVGGIAGRVESTSEIKYCYNTANVFAYSQKAYAIAEKSENSVYLSNNLDNNTSYGTPVSSLTEPTGSNVKVTSQYVGPENTENYSLSETYVSNLGEDFQFVQDDTIRLKWQIEMAEAVEKITVNYYHGDELIKSVIFADEVESMLTLMAYSLEGYSFKGWATSKDGEVAYNKNQQFTFEEAKAIAVDNVLNFYAVLEENLVEQNALVVAYLESKASPELMASVETAFRSYLNTNDKAITDLVFRGYAQTAVADYTQAILDDGDADIVLGVGGNIDSKGSLIDYVTSKTSYSINNDASRYYACLSLGNNSENLATFVEFLETDEAKATFNPAQRTDTLYVAVYAKYVSTDIQTALETAFRQYLTDNSITITNLQFVALGDSSTKVAAFVDLVQSNELTFDVVIGGGSNIGTTAGTTSGTKLSVSNTAVTISGSERQISVLEGSQNTVNCATLVGYMTSDAASAILNPAA